MTFNVHGCRGLDRQWSPERIASVIASCHPDAVALQELDAGRARSGGVHQAEVIAQDLGMDLQFFPTMQVMTERYGDAILSRWPARLIKAQKLPGLEHRQLEPRGAIWCEITLPGAAVQIINTHLSLSARERRLQVGALLGADWLRHPACRDPVVLLGDFNMAPGGPSYRRIVSCLRDAGRAAVGGPRRRLGTFPTRFPTLRLDHIFVGPSISVLDVSTVRTPLARLASDHLPLVAELAIPAKPSATHLDASSDRADGGRKAALQDL